MIELFWSHPRFRDSCDSYGWVKQGRSVLAPVKSNFSQALN